MCYLNCQVSHNHLSNSPFKMNSLFILHCPSVKYQVPIYVQRYFFAFYHILLVRWPNLVSIPQAAVVDNLIFQST